MDLGAETGVVIELYDKHGWLGMDGIEMRNPGRASRDPILSNSSSRFDGLLTGHDNQEQLSNSRRHQLPQLSTTNGAPNQSVSLLALQNLH